MATKKQMNLIGVEACIISSLLLNGWRMSRVQGLPTNCDDDHAKYLSPRGACVGVGSMRVLGRCPEEQDTFASLVFAFVCFDNSSLNFSLLYLDVVVYLQALLTLLLKCFPAAHLLALD
jgi:hypothetical protein